MESSQAAFEDLERALGFARFTSDHHDRTSSASRETASTEISTDLARVPDSEDEDGLDTVPDPENIETPSPWKDEARSVVLPPTPPTPEKTKVPQAYHSPLRTGQTQGDLRSEPSGLSSPGVDWHSFPTPDPSPPRTRENLLLPFYLLDHNPSSHADSFRTAEEGQSRAESPTSAHLFYSPGSAQTSLAMSLQANATQPTPLARDDTSSQTRGEDLNPSDTAPGPGDEVEQRRHSPFDVGGASDLAPTSPTVTRSLSQGTAQRRLWSVIKPGDAVKRPDQSLLYINHANSVVQKRPVAPSGLIVQAKAYDGVDDLSQQSQIWTGIDAAPEESTGQSVPDSENHAPKIPIQKGAIEPTPHAQPVLKDGYQEPQPTDSEEHSSTGSRSLRDSEGQNIVGRSVEDGITGPTPGISSDPIMTKADDHPQDINHNRPRTPHSATKSSLEDNNVVYKLIREENVKRHSNISDGSVQAVVVALPEHKRTLRHTPKRHSLRGDASLTSNSHRSSADESGRKSIKRNTGTTFTASDTDLTSPDISPSIAKAALKTAPALQLPPSTSVDPPAQAIDRRSPRDASSGAPTVILARRSSGSQSTQYHSLRRRSKHGQSLETTHDLHNNDDDNEIDDHMNNDTPDDPTEATDPDGMRRVGSPPMHQAAQMSSKPVYVPLADLYTPPRLRRFSNESRLERNTNLRRISLDSSVQRTSQPLEIKLEQAAKELTREGHELLDDRHSLALTSTLTSPKRGSFDVHLLRPTHASFSVSQASMPTDVELLEARGVTLYPHHNESLLVVQQGPRPTGDGAGLDRPRTSGADATAYDGNTPESAVNVRPRATSVDAIGKPKHAVDSPLTNPRAPPEPPTIRFIPPTPSEELEAELTLSRDHQAAASTASIPQRRPSLSQRVRRYSESLIQPLGFGGRGSLRRQQRRPPPNQPHQHHRATTFSGEERPTHLSSFWHPRGFWEDVDSDGDDVFDDDDPALVEMATLPPGGDTSYQTERASAPYASSMPLFPRNMSVRMPGFRGTGGFLLGNSLGIDRHGTNNRRPYVRWPSSEEQRRRRVAERRQARVWGEKGAGDLPQNKHHDESRHGGPPPRHPLDHDRTAVGSTDPRSTRLLVIPSFGAESTGFQVEYVGLQFLRDHFRALRARRADAALERRRDVIRSSIGTKVYHDSRYGAS